MQGIRDPEIRKMIHVRTRGSGRIFIASTGGEEPGNWAKELWDKPSGFEYKDW